MKQLEPRNKELLGDLKFGPDEKRPLGGINPYSSHFNQIGDRFKNLLIEFARLNPSSDVLDVGCGTGRLAKSLVPYLDSGSYTGIDVNRQKKGFKGKKNADLWKRFLLIYHKHNVSFQWVKGHAGHPENEKCDQLAVEASDFNELLIDQGYEQSIDSNTLF